MEESTYSIAPKGMATSFGDATIPVEYVLIDKNRYRNAAGNAEKRQGIVQLGADVASGAGGAVTNTALHEMTQTNGTVIKLVSDDDGDIYRYNASANVWDLATNSAFTQAGTLQSVQFKEKLIFTNGLEPPMWTEDAVSFTELKALHEVGTMTGDTSAAAMFDANVTNFVGNTNVVENDLVYNVNLGVYGAVTAITSVRVEHTPISSSSKGIGIATRNQDAGDLYEIIDTIELNIVTTESMNITDNTTTTLAGTDATTVIVSGVADFTKTEIRIGDFVRNTTRNAITQVTAIATASIGVHGIADMSSGDSIIFTKSAMPQGDSPHVHYNRLYMLDSRDKKKIRISGADDAQDFSRDSATLDTSNFSIDVSTYDRQSFDFGSLQPEGDELLGIASWQRFIAFIGRKSIYFYQGTVPIGDNADLAAVGLFPQGCVSKFAFANIGNMLAFASPNGIEGVSFGNDSLVLSQEQMSSQINTTLRTSIENTSESEMRMFLYQKRSWLVFKIGGEMWVYNTTPVVTEGTEEIIGSWHLFDGKFAQMNDFLVGSNGTLTCCGSDGKVAEFDQDTYDDLGDNISTEYRTGWLSMAEPKSRITTKHGRYLKPLFETGENITYTILIEAPYNAESSETIIVDTSGATGAIGLAVVGTAVIGGSPVVNTKYSLRWRGERARLTISTSDTKGKDIISNFTFYYTEAGIQ